MNKNLPELDPYIFSMLRGDIRVHLFPQIHNSLLFTQYTEKAFTEFQIDHLILELPSELERLFLKAVARFPTPSLLTKTEYVQEKIVELNKAGYIVHIGEPLFYALNRALRKKIVVSFMDSYQEAQTRSRLNDLRPLELATIGWKTYFEGINQRIVQHFEDATKLKRSLAMGKNVLSEVQKSKSKNLLVMIGAAHFLIIEEILLRNGFRRQYQRLSNWSPEKLISTIGVITENADQITDLTSWVSLDIHPNYYHYLTDDLPFFIGHFWKDPSNFDLIDSLKSLYLEAGEAYFIKFDTPITTISYVKILQYLRNLSRVRFSILPGVIDIVTAAKGIVDDDYGFEVYRLAITSPFRPKHDEEINNSVKIAIDPTSNQWFKFVFKRRYRRPILQKVQDQNDWDELDPFPDEDWSGQWQEVWDQYSDFGYVSYPPEDEFIENYFEFLRKKIIEILREEISSVSIFEGSLEDGIDYKETIRHFHEGKLYVKKIPNKDFQIGALIVQFLEEPYDEQEYNYHTTMFAEHDKESHISIVSSTPGDVLVGPGISRIKYAAIISQYPPVALPVLIPFGVDDLKLKLLATALEMSLGKIIALVSPKPPTSAQRYLVSSNGFRLIYLPMDNLTKISLNRLRIMHILAHRSLREIAREYIGY